MHAPRHDGRRESLLACGIGLVLGWYDGFFGPGTGSFFIFLFVRVLGYDFLNASASAISRRWPWRGACRRPRSFLVRV